MPEQLIFDPADENTGAELEVLDDTYTLMSFEAPAPPLDLSAASSVDTEGEVPFARRHQNRRVSIVLETVGATATALDDQVATLAMKVAKIAREGGTLRRVRSTGVQRTADLLAADSWEPQFDVKYFDGNTAQVAIGLVAKPYARGEEVEVATASETTNPALIFEVESIPGDVPALGRLVVENDQGVNAFRLHWGIESRWYDPSSSLFFAAPDPLNGTSQTDGDAFGGSAIRTAVDDSAWIGCCYIGNDTGEFNAGQFRVLVRGRPGSGNTGNVRMRLAYQPVLGGPTTVLTPVDVDPAATLYTLFDLGVINVPYPVKGTPLWQGWVEAISTRTGAGDYHWIDTAFLVPAAEGAGQLYTGPGPIDATHPAEVSHQAVLLGASSPFVPPQIYEGDYLLLPPSGMEERPARVFVKLSTANADDGSSTAFADATIYDTSATLYATPRHLSMV